MESMATESEYPYYTFTSTYGTTARQPWSVIERTGPQPAGSGFKSPGPENGWLIVALYRSQYDARAHLRSLARQGHRVVGDKQAERIAAGARR